MAPDHLLHITLNTGHTIRSPRSGPSGAAQEVLESLDTIIANGGGYILDRKTTCQISGAVGAWVFDVSAPLGEGEDPWPLILAGVVADQSHADAMWSRLAQTYTDVYEESLRAEQPTDTPWLAVMILPAPPREILRREWLADFERCLAWALIEGPRGEDH